MIYRFATGSALTYLAEYRMDVQGAKQAGENVPANRSKKTMETSSFFSLDKLKCCEQMSSFLSTNHGGVQLISFLNLEIMSFS